MADTRVHCVYLVVLVLLVILVGGQSTTATIDEQHPARDFSRHIVIKPKIYHGREKRQIATSKIEGPTKKHLEHLIVTIPIEGQNWILDLTLNRQLIPKSYFTKYQEHGSHKIVRPGADEVELCHYGGTVRGKSDSWVALSTCHGLSGIIYDGSDMYYVERGEDPQDNALEVKHFFYKHSDLAPHNKSCGYGGDAVDPEKVHSHNRMSRYKRSTERNDIIRGPYNANKESKYVELVLVVDNREFKELGESTSKVEHHCKTIANIINALYAPLNIFIALVGVVIWTEHDEISFSVNGDTTLTNFLHYRREKLVKEHPNDNAQLLTKFNFENGVVGKALKGPICTYEYSGGVSTDHSAVVGLVATTVAHEMGHNFGMEHDTNECKCPEDRCIMAPSSSTVAPTHWSSCSLNYLLLAFTHGMDYCLKNKPAALFDSPFCGNGFVEPGEQCDCGLPHHCDNTCCNATTCMLYNNASCATGECCDLNTCKPKNAGTLCRSADYECDLPEYCTGQSEYCPADIYKMDTEECDSGKAFCYHGFCRTRTDQCKLLWGETGKSSDEQCYQMNVKGTRHGNCGYNKFNQSFFKCNDENVLCGMLHCKHLNERLEFGMESVSILSHSFINLKGSIVPCRTAIVDLGINQVDPGLAPDGAKCGENKMCVNQKCMEVASLRRTAPTCPQDCNGNGWCNNLGHCHCKEGFAPPFCENPGPGGSEDSGPATDPNARREFVAALFIIFLGIIPGMLIATFLAYYLKRNGIKLHKPRLSAPPAISKSPPKARGAPFSSDITKRTEDNHSLLQPEASSPSPGFQNEFFGNFKGFSLTPMKNAEVNRSAPPPPVIPPSKQSTVNRSNSSTLRINNLLNKSVARAQSFKNNISEAISNVHSTSSAPAAPPHLTDNPTKPVISSPILENSTCTAKELISPLRHASKTPFRSAPEVPPANEHKRPLSTPDASVISEELPRKRDIGGALNRITSFLKPDKKPPLSNTGTLPRNNQIKASKILDKSALRAMPISNPIPQTDVTLSVKAVPVNSEESKNVVMRAQSMRGTNVTTRPNIPTFGSMRQPNGIRRPVSIPSGTRPKSPPPPRPPGVGPPDNGNKITIPSLPGYQKPANKSPTSPQYDDCLNKQTSSDCSSTDNIYAVIEESPVSPDKSKASSGSASSESMGLLGEIVSEIQNRNFDSIYSTSTLARKKKEEEEKQLLKNKALESPDSTYVNTSSLYKSPESIYSNMTSIKSSASSTSSGYIHPSLVNVPAKGPKSSDNVAKTADKPPTLSSFKADAGSPSKPSVSTFSRPQSRPDSKVKSPPSPSTKTAPKTLSRQTTPTSLQTRKPSPTRPNPPNLAGINSRSKINRPAANSPDVVSSCNKPSSKPPDVLNGGPTSASTNKKPSIISAKPSISAPKGTPPKATIKALNSKPQQDKKPATDKPSPPKSRDNQDAAKALTTKTVARQSSNVASLQQKFENKTIGNKNVLTKTKA